MGSCISAHYAPGQSKEIPFMSSRRGKRKRRAKGNEAEGNDGSSDRRPAISAAASASTGSGCVVAEDELQRVQGRLFLNGTSEVACLYTQQGKKGTNQDAMLVWENFASRDDTIFCGVFDGHGPYGHMVARKVRDSLPLELCNQWRGTVSGLNSPHQNGLNPCCLDSEETGSTSIDDEWGKSVDVELKEKPPEMYLPLRQSFLKAFQSMDTELKFNPSINCFCSGTTAVTIIKQGQDLVIGNVGDSRAILGTRDKDNNLVAVQLTVDLKPNLPREAERIHRCNGRVFALQDEPEVARVWLPNNDSPGLAMARAFGDFCLKDFGLISVPDISYRGITEKDEFIVLATDGIWDALSNKEVVDIVASAPTRGTAARALVDCAVRSWRLKFPTSKIDDCAAICLYLESSRPNESPISSSPQTETAKEEEITEITVNETQTSSSIDTDEIVPAPPEEPKQAKSKPIRSLQDCMAATDEEEWSALEGITRVNSLLSIPRFLTGDKRSSRRKWL